ncbi:hypothetical protein AVEN_103-1 [Araneus ventricosus]|uniref:Uncharacterized protein n=1 Tax=Araneus ventricosus TaxID=182803 RepID=A0A4Y2D323_ARAVE|nr:hypothetical protein AVEN_103-1 [Araneus ventricosus]
MGKPERPRKQYNIKEEIEEAQIALKDDIPSLKEALNGPNSEEWLEAMRTEYNAILKTQTCSLVKPKDKKNNWFKVGIAYKIQRRLLYCFTKSSPSC